MRCDDEVAEGRSSLARLIIDVGSHLIAGRNVGIRRGWGKGSSPTMSAYNVGRKVTEYAARDLV